MADLCFRNVVSDNITSWIRTAKERRISITRFELRRSTVFHILDFEMIKAVVHRRS